MRVTLSYTTLCFFLLALATCITQSTLTGLTFAHSMKNRIFVTSVIHAAGIQRGFANVHDGALEICYGIPTVRGTTCEVVYDGTIGNDQGTGFFLFVLPRLLIVPQLPQTTTQHSPVGVF